MRADCPRSETVRSYLLREEGTVGSGVPHADVQRPRLPGAGQLSRRPAKKEGEVTKRRGGPSGRQQAMFPQMEQQARALDDVKHMRRARAWAGHCLTCKG